MTSFLSDIVAAYPIHAISQEGHKAVCTYTGATSGAFKIMGNGVSNRHLSPHTLSLSVSSPPVISFSLGTFFLRETGH